MRAFQHWLGPLIIASSLAGQAHAVSEKVFEQEFAQRILPDFWDLGRSAFITAPDGVKIHYRQYVKSGQSRALVILPGRTESTFKFAEFIYDIRDLNLAVFIIDHRGQGASGREVDEPQMQYVQDFSYYRDDLSLLMNEVVKPHGFQETYAMGHSMGANIISLLMVQQPEVFNKVVVSSPMLDINSYPFPFQWTAYAFTGLAGWLGLDKSFVPGHGPFKPSEKYRGTSSAVRYKAFHELRVQKKEQLIGGVSYRFAQKALQATWDMREAAAKLIAPILMLQAGNDDVVLTGGQDYVCQRAKHCRKVVFPKARHEIHIETDDIRDQWLQEIRQFIAAP